MELINLSYSNHQMYTSNCVATIGYFDGIHKAHKALIDKTILIAKEKNLKSMVITFDSNIKKSEFDLINLGDKIILFENFNIDYLVILKFDENFKNVSPEEFIDEFLVKNNIKELVIGFDFRFGKKASGKSTDIELLSSNKIKVSIVDEIFEGTTKVGTSQIKHFLSNGEVKKANKMLGYNFFINGKVVHGKQIGKSIGLPTANILVENKSVLLRGVYFVKVFIGNNQYFGIANYGNNPTFNYQKALSLEVNIFDFSSDIYGEIVKVEFIDFVRPEIKFKNVDEFLKQIEKDKKICFKMIKKISDYTEN